MLFTSRTKVCLRVCAAIGFASATLGCDEDASQRGPQIEEAVVEQYFRPLIENKSLKVRANQPHEELFTASPARCYRIDGTTSADPVTITVLDDGSAPVRTTQSQSGAFEIGHAHSFCVRVVKGPYYLRISSKTDARIQLSVRESQD